MTALDSSVKQMSSKREVQLFERTSLCSQSNVDHSCNEDGGALARTPLCLLAVISLLSPVAVGGPKDVEPSATSWSCCLLKEHGAGFMAIEVLRS